MHHRTIVPRHLRFEFDSNIAKHWLDESQTATHLINGFHLVFPRLERFLIRCLVAVQKEIRDELLAEQVQGFIAQEANHAREHERFLLVLEQQGFKLRPYLDWQNRFLRRFEKRFSPHVGLAISAAGEHYTAIFGHWALQQNPFSGAPSALRELLMWHAAEEIEHKAVVFDVPQHLRPSYALRQLGLTIASATLATLWTGASASLIRQEEAPGENFAGRLQWYARSTSPPDLGSLRNSVTTCDQTFIPGRRMICTWQLHTSNPTPYLRVKLMKIRSILNRALLLAFCLASVGCRERIMYKIVESQGEVWQGYRSGDELTHVNGKIYSFRWKHYRSMVINTSEGLVVVDSFNPVAATRLSARLAEQFPGKKVHTLIYSHYHVDHSSGGAILKPAHVIAHEKSPGYWKDLHNAEMVLAPTKLIAGDETLVIGNTSIELLYLGRSHTDTSIAVFVPEEKALFVADMATVRTIPPHFDVYLPGVIQALERLCRLDFEHFVPSHFQLGTKADFVDAVVYLQFMRTTVRKAMEKFGGEGGVTLPVTGSRTESLFRYVYTRAKKQYSGWRGFDQSMVANVFRWMVGDRLGF